MIEFTANTSGLAVDYETGNATLTLSSAETKNIMNSYDSLKGKKLTVKIAEYRKKRSLDANAYAWVLMDRLAQKINTPKAEIYRSYIREIGGNSETVCVKTEAVDKLCEGWQHNGLGWMTDIVPSKIDGCVNVVLYYGSSTYNTLQMSRLIELIVSDCQDQGIQTMTPDELLNLTSLWGQK